MSPSYTSATVYMNMNSLFLFGSLTVTQTVWPTLSDYFKDTQGKCPGWKPDQSISSGLFIFTPSHWGHGHTSANVKQIFVKFPQSRTAWEAELQICFATRSKCFIRPLAHTDWKWNEEKVCHGYIHLCVAVAWFWATMKLLDPITTLYLKWGRLDMMTNIEAVSLII